VGIDDWKKEFGVRPEKEKAPPLARLEVRARGEAEARGEFLMKYGKETV
jgi:hypothetical protein